MFLTGREIVRRQLVDAPGRNAVQPASVDLRIGAETLALCKQRVIVGQLAPVSYEKAVAEGAITLPPERFLLAATMESVYIPAGLVGRVEGKSSLARIGLIVHTTAGWIDPGFDGPVTLELKNAGPATIVIPVGSYICQLSVAQLHGSSFPDIYKGKYAHATGVQGARWTP